MHSEIDYTSRKNTQLQERPVETNVLLEEHSVVLDKYNLLYKSTKYYYEIGEPEWTQGWIIDVSVIPIQFESLLEIIIPVLIEEKTAFKVAKDAGIARNIMNGDMGLFLLGKFVAIYPPDGPRAANLAARLISLTTHLKGPEILTDRQLGNVVYTRYGACKGVKVINDLGFEERHIYNAKGDLVKDPYSIPFVQPEATEWPFSRIALANSPKKETVLQERYRPMATLKDDAKGFVKKGLYLEKYWRIKWCIIKEGKRCMLGDSKGRDMADRLRWQYELHKELEGILPLPMIYDLFEENGDTYLVMEFIKGVPLHHFISSILNGRTWHQLILADKLKILDLGTEVLNITQQLHAKGYIHRDITPANFLIDKKMKLWMIDLELSYCQRKKKPQWPFRLGTLGFMSPEQAVTLTPTVKEDVYAIGALFIFLFTGLMPDKFAQKDSDSLTEQLRFFIPDKELIGLLVDCLEKDHTKRPDIFSFKLKVKKFRDEQVLINTAAKSEITFKSIPVNENILKNVIQDGLSGLVDPVFLNSDHLWLSRSAQEDGFAYEHNGSVSIYAEFYQGLSGIIWLLARANKLDFSIVPLKDYFDKNLSFARRKFRQRSKDAPAGFYFGTAGMALAMVEGICSKLLPATAEIMEEIKIHLQHDNVIGYDIAMGLAGQGMVLLKSLTLINEPVIHQLLQQKVELLLTHQEKDGSWINLSNGDNSLHKTIGFGRGVAGIACFLMEYIRQYKDDHSVRHSVAKAMSWLTKHASRRKGQAIWPIRTGTKLFSFGFQDGFAGIVLAMVNAYDVLGNPQYRELAEDCLRGYAPFPVSVDITQASGLSGYGEVYLEAEKILGTGEWKNRANWIAEFILHHFNKSKDGSNYWIPNDIPFTTAGLMEGSSGIIHFLLRCYKPDSLSHPLLVC